MVDIEQLTDEILNFFATKFPTNYRICVLIVGSPGSGKSTIANKLRDNINRKYSQFEKDHALHSHIPPENNDQKAQVVLDYMLEGIEEISDTLKQTLSENKGILPLLVEDYTFEPKKITNVDNTMVIGRGGTPNAVKLALSSKEKACEQPQRFVEVVPMDGFHLSRRCLDQFKDPVQAYKRRGSPQTFDSNNFLQLIKIIQKTMMLKPNNVKEDSNVFEKAIRSTRKDIPSIYIPGFDHSLKDPTPDAYCISNSTRIVILEGLYLFYKDENWRSIYPILNESDAIIPYYIDINLNVTELRVAKRHLESGLVNTIEEGKEKFCANDRLNALLVEKSKKDIKNLKIIRND